MKKRNIIIIALVIAVLIAAVLLLVKPGAQSESKEPSAQAKASEKQTEKQTNTKPATSLPESGTVYLDENKKISASFGVAEGDGAIEEEDEPENVQASEKPETENKLPPVPMPEEPAKSSYEEFYALSPEQKDEFMHSFDSLDDFYDWLTAAQAEFKNLHPEIEIGPGGVIDLSKLR